MTVRSDPLGVKIGIEVRNVVIRVGSRLLAVLGWTKGDTIAVLVGEGERAGQVRLSREKPGWKLQLPGGNAKNGAGTAIKFGKSFGGCSSFPDMPESFPMTVVTAKIVDGGIEFRVPWRAAVIDASPDEEHDRGMIEAFDREKQRLEGVIEEPELTSPHRDKIARKLKLLAEVRSIYTGDTDGLVAQAYAAGGRRAEEMPPAPPPSPPIPPPAARVTSAPPKADPSDPDTWPQEMVDRFVEAAAHGAFPVDLARISGGAPSTQRWMADQYFGPRIRVRKRELTRAPPLKPRPSLVRAESPETAEPPAKPVLTTELLTWLREEIKPALPFGSKLTKNADGTGLILDGLPASLHQVVAKANADRDPGDHIAIPDKYAVIHDQP
jgi:hypothetical protein